MTVTDQFTITGSTGVEIAASIERAVRTSALPPGTKLPTIRSIARELRVSPTTVASAYRRLQLRGIVGSEGRRGTRISHRPPLPARAPEVVPPGARNLASGNPDPDLLPDLAPSLDRLPRRPLYGEHMNSPQLIDLAVRAFSEDGIRAGPIAVVGGALDGTERILAAHLRPGDGVAVEDPGFTRVLDLITALGLIAIPVGMDARGMLPHDLAAALGASVEAIVITPRAQNPTGAALDDQRAAELRAVIDERPDLLVIEDDHASSIAGVSATTLTMGRDRWAILRSVSKTLGPDLRLALMTGDTTTIARVEGRQLLGTGWVSRILQDLVVALWSDADTSDLMAAAESVYADRRAGLVQALSSRGVAVDCRSGNNVWIPVPDESAAAASLLQRGWAVARGEPFRLRSQPALRITTATLTPEESGRFADDLQRALEPSDLRTYA